MLTNNSTKSIEITSKERIENLLCYWKKQAVNAPPLLELPFNYPRQSQTSYRKNSLSFNLSKSCTDSLRELSEQSDTNLSITLLAAYNTLLYRYTHQEDILVASPVTSLGFSITGKLLTNPPNTIIIRTDLSGNPRFLELLERIDKVARSADANKDLPFELLEERLSSERGQEQPYLSQVSYTFRNAFDSKTENNKLSSVQKDKQTPPFDLTLSLENTPRGLTGVWEYNAELFKDDTIQRLAEHFCILVEGIVTNPEQKISHLPILSRREHHQLLVEWNSTYVKYPHGRCLHELFEEQVKCSPATVAVKLYDGQGASASNKRQEFTYAELNAKANQLAHYLQEVGVGPEVMVGICMKRSLEMVVGLLGILKAGGAYVPLDPSYPKERLTYMLKDAKIPVLLTQQQLTDQFEDHDALTICLDTNKDKIAKYSGKNCISEVKSENLAYVIYTSGSTGMPKGTLIMHRGVVNYLSWCTKAYSVAAGNGAPVNSSIGFDATITSLFSPLLVGKCVILLPEEGEIEALGKILQSKSNLSLVKITPAHLEILRHLLSHNEVEEQSNAFIIGGEALLGKSISLWRKYAPRTRLINEYGPTETVVGCCTYEVSAQDEFENIPIGRPIANTQMYILDRYMQPVPIGVAGEIYIGGAGLARGYLNRAELTAKRFVSNPFSADPNSRLYKTGDSARILNDGNIVFLGRIDQQVKLRGYRIELGEIESILNQHEAVKQVLVLALEDASGDKKLIAYLVFNEGREATSADLRLFLSTKLPEYMLPSVFIFLDTMPLTPNGKVDRSALPVPDHKRELEKTYIAPRNFFETELTKIFEDCLKINPIGVQDNFFELGGSSIQAAIVFSKIRKLLGKQLPLTTLLSAPTIEQLAIFLSKKGGSDLRSSLVPIQPYGSKPPFFVMHGGAGNVLFYQNLAPHLGMDQPLYALQPKGLNGFDTPHTRIEDMAAHYITEIRSVQPDGPFFLGGYCLGAILAFEMAQQLSRQGHKVALLANFNGISPGTVDPTEISDNNELKESTNEPFAQIITDYWKKFARLSAKEKMVFPVRLVKNILWNYKTKSTIRRYGYKFYLSLGRPLPEPLLKNFFLVTNSKIANAYVPHCYGGRMIIFRSPDIYKDDPTLGWDGLLAGGIGICNIAGDHINRRDIMNEPFVQNLAKELEDYLSGGQKSKE